MILCRTRRLGIQTATLGPHTCAASIYIGWGIADVGQRAPGRLRNASVYRYSIHVAWDWTPTVQRQHEDWEQWYADRGMLAPRLGIRSSAWTGRRETVYDWAWKWWAEVRIGAVAREWGWR